MLHQKQQGCSSSQPFFKHDADRGERCRQLHLTGDGQPEHCGGDRESTSRHRLHNAIPDLGHFGATRFDIEKNRHDMLTEVPDLDRFRKVQKKVRWNNLTQEELCNLATSW